MEWQFRINWPAVVEEAKERRQKLKLTQQRLAELAGVSTPTVSHFENGKKDIQLSTITAILRVLGMLDERTLTFPESEPRLGEGRSAVLFDGKDGDRSITCWISKEALTDHFDPDARGPDLLRTFQSNHDRIEAEARRKYLSGDLHRDGSVRIETMDLYR